MTVILIGGLGLRAIDLCAKMLRSGQHFMAVHKANAKILQAQMKLRAPDYVPGLWTVPTASITTLRLPDLSQAALWISVLATVGALTMLMFSFGDTLFKWLASTV